MKMNDDVKSITSLIAIQTLPSIALDFTVSIWAGSVYIAGFMVGMAWHWWWKRRERKKMIGEICALLKVKGVTMRPILHLVKNEKNN